MTDVIVDRNDNKPVAPPATGFHFVDQGNYLTTGAPEPGTALTLYSDSATSCIIVIVVADTVAGTSLTLAHLDSAPCIETFFDIVARRQDKSLQIYAQGANPPDNVTAQENAAALRKAISGLGPSVSTSDLFLLEGDPRADNRGDFGIQAAASGTITVSNQPYVLKLTDRDPTCGGQTVYCIMRRQEVPPVQLRNAGLPFTHDELVSLSSIAISFRKAPDDPSTSFTNIVNMEGAAIRESWSTTPQYEAPWFSDQLKQGACFAIAMAPVVSLSAQYLVPPAERPFARLRKAVLGDI
ncbi:hypothetical protein [Celeribacter sp.]|uniref:hypothetical protein n=1 Tax=Alphaproteobacteria TaxID=28211 RepID=UPI003A8E566B